MGSGNFVALLSLGTVPAFLSDHFLSGLYLIPHQHLYKVIVSLVYIHAQAAALFFITHLAEIQYEALSLVVKRGTRQACPAPVMFFLSSDL